jgi:two-component system, chemotaxis family, chemotaxis protein CheY
LPADKSPVFLVVDDSDITRKMIKTALRPLNPVFREASSGLEALEQVMLRNYDVVTLDLNMPDMHGLEFLRFMRSHKTLQKIPILVVTTQLDVQMQAEVLSAGANGYITKPFSPEEILSKVQALLEKS